MFFKFVFVLLTILTLVYLFHTLKFFIGLFKFKSGQNHHRFSISIIVPARNEEKNIARCLDSLVSQDYPDGRYEIIVVDDNSNDRTTDIVKDYSRRYPFIKLIKNEEKPAKFSYKKAALQKGIEASENEIIFTIDADCVAQRGWLKRMMQHFEPTVGMVAGMVVFNDDHEKRLFHKVQSLEFLGLISAGAGSIGLGRPLIGNGANLAYRKGAFQEVEGFEGIGHFTSGDDDLLMQKLHRLSSWKVRFCPASETINYTHPAEDFKSFLNQRARWASKGMHYPNASLVAFLVCTYLYYLGLLLVFLFSLVKSSFLPLSLISLLLKSGVDFLVTFKGCRFAQRLDLIKYFPLTEAFHIGYILYAGAAGLLGSFHWKGRRNN